MKNKLRCLSVLGQETKEQVLSEVAAESIQSIQDATITHWLPAELDVEVTRKVFDLAGQDRLNEWIKETVLVSGRGPLLGPIVKSATRLFGIKISHMIKYVVLGWRAVTRDCGELASRVEGDDRGVFQLTDMTPLFFEEYYLKASAASFEAAFQLIGKTGQVRLVPESMQNRQALFEISW